jgi:hypothetical protein
MAIPIVDETRSATGQVNPIPISITRSSASSVSRQCNPVQPSEPSQGSYISGCPLPSPTRTSVPPLFTVVSSVPRQPSPDHTPEPSHGNDISGSPSPSPTRTSVPRLFTVVSSLSRQPSPDQISEPGHGNYISPSPTPIHTSVPRLSTVISSVSRQLSPLHNPEPGHDSYIPASPSVPHHVTSAAPSGPPKTMSEVLDRDDFEEALTEYTDYRCAVTHGKGIKLKRESTPFSLGVPAYLTDNVQNVVRYSPRAK